MREMKFRGMDANGIMRYGRLSQDKPDTTLYFSEYSQRICWDDSNIPVSNKTLGQYIGGKDDNDKEVYENDIIKCVISGLNDEKPIICIVKWLQDETRFVAQLVNELVGIMPLCYRISAMQSIEVIGNIYENPDLLNP